MTAPQDHTPFFILQDKLAVAEPSYQEWSVWMATHDRTVAVTAVLGVTVSTVFLGIDHNFCATTAPSLFETMVFTDEEAGRTHSYATWEEAAAGHQRLVALIREEHALAERLTLDILLRLGQAPA